MSSTTAPAPPPSRPGLRAAWSTLDHRQHRVVAAAALVLLTLALPWYSQETVARDAPGSFVRSGGSISGLAGMSFIEASLLVVLAGVLAMLWGRGTRRQFTLPYPDGTLVCAAGAWMGLLIVYRLFARPHGEDSAQELTVIGLNWGIFVSLLAVGVLFAAGFDLRRHGPRNAVPGEPGPAPPDRYPDVDPATMVVGPRRDERETAVVPSSPRTPPAPAPRPDEQPTTVVPPPRPDDEQTHEWPSRMPRPPRTPRPQPPDERR